MGESVSAVGWPAEPPAPPLILPGEMLSIGCSQTADEIVLTLVGELDIATAGYALGYVRDVLDRHDRPVVLNLALLRFCDAHGLGALVRMGKYADQVGHTLRLMSPQPQVMRIMRITNLSHELAPADPAVTRVAPPEACAWLHGAAQIPPRPCRRRTSWAARRRW